MSEAQKNAIKHAKIKWRNCKGELTRQGKIVSIWKSVSGRR